MILLELANAEFKVRISATDGETWFLGKDVADVLGIKNSRDALARLHEDERSEVVISDTRSKGDATQRRTMTVINESGLYALIFQSRKPEAERFRRWVTGVVLPAVRQGRMPEPFINQVRISEAGVDVEKARENLRRTLDMKWQLCDVPGNVSIKAYVRAVGLDITTKEAMSLGASMKSRAAGLGYACGRIRQRRSRYGPVSDKPNEDRCGWQAVATYPPAELHAECIRRGWIAEDRPLPSEEQFAAVLRPLINRAPYKLLNQATG